jgi:hypothetical protein
MRRFIECSVGCHALFQQISPPLPNSLFWDWLKEMNWVFAIKFRFISLKISLTDLFYGFSGGDWLVFPLILVANVLSDDV